MTPGHHALTDKEKQALRLLTTGYDAKSMARHLGLSVHTVNERLRDARRKMATSSSREAARQLRDVEGAAPEKTVDKDLGGATGAALPADPTGQSGTRSTPGRSRWIIGGTTMSIVLIAATLATLAAPEAAVPTGVSAITEAAPVTAARQFLTLVDANDWAASWAVLGRSMRAQNTVQTWTDASKSVRTGLGALKHRDQASADYVPAPPAGYWMVKFRASYANKPEAIETLTLMQEADGWHVVGITID